MTKKASGNNVPKAKRKRTRPRKSKGITGKGDYDLNGDMAFDDAIEDIDKRISRLEKVKPSANGATTLVGQGAGILGRLAGGLLGGPGGANLGEQAATGLARFLGHGDYEITTNSLIGKPPAGEGMPKFQKDGSRGTRICEREYIGDVYSGGTLVAGSTTFNLQAFPLNPGMQQTFPWLATIAQQYETYKPNGIIFEFKTTSSEFNGTSQNLGTVICATDYDPTDSPYINKTQMEAADFSDSTKASASLMHGIECDTRERGDQVLYVRAGDISSSDNLRFYDLGIFEIATQGMSAANVNLGELWVSYDFTFYKKNLTNGILGFNVLFNIFKSTVAPTAANPLGTPVVYGNANATNVGTTIFFDPTIATGVFLIEYWATAASFASPITFVSPVNCEALPDSTFVPSFTFSETASFGGSTWRRMFVRILAPKAAITLSVGAITTGASADFLVLQFNGQPSIPLTT